MWLKLSIVLFLAHRLSANCDVCLPGRAACHSENTYSICLNDEPTKNEMPCPDGHVCTGEKFICYPEDEGYKPICKPGDAVPIDSTTTPETTPESTTPDTNFKSFCTNNGNGNFKLEGDTSCKSFIYCFNGRGQKRDCENINKKETYFNGVECSLEKPEYCYTPTESTTLEITTPEITTAEITIPEITTPESTTPKDTTPDTNYRTYCANKATGDHKNEDDPTCLTYIYCQNGRGQKRDCQKETAQLLDTYFNGSKCSREKPDYCT